MNFDQWKKLPKRRQKEITRDWDVNKDEGRDIATAVLRAFIGRYGSNKGIGIDSQVIRLRDNTGWAIGVQCFNEAGLKITPKNYLGIPVSRLYVDHIDDGIFLQLIPGGNYGFIPGQF